MDIYSLSRQFFDWTYENTDMAKPNHIALYFFIIEHNNRLGWKQKFGLPSSMAKEAIGIKSYNTYSETFKDLVNWGFIKVVQESKNQFSSTIISISKPKNALLKNKSALDKALIKHGTKHSEGTVQSTGESIDSIDIQVYNNTNLPINNILLEKESKENFLKIDIEPNILENEISPAEKLESGNSNNFTSKGKNPKKEAFTPNFDFCENSPLKPILMRWLDYKKWKGQRYKGQDSVETMFRQLVKYSNNDPTIALEIIEDAIAKNYSGFFKPQKQNLQNGSTKEDAGNKAPTYGGFSESAINDFFGK